MDEGVVLRGSFSLITKKEPRNVEVTLTKKSLSYTIYPTSSCCMRSECRLCVINLSDVYGAKAFKGRDDSAVYFQIYACPLRKKRQKEKTCFKVLDSTSFEANITVAEKWIRAILWLAKEPACDLSEIQGKLDSRLKKKRYVELEHKPVVKQHSLSHVY